MFSLFRLITMHVYNLWQLWLVFSFSDGNGSMLPSLTLLITDLWLRIVENSNGKSKIFVSNCFTELWSLYCKEVRAKLWCNFTFKLSFCGLFNSRCQIGQLFNFWRIIQRARLWLRDKMQPFIAKWLAIHGLCDISGSSMVWIFLVQAVRMVALS